MRKECLNKPDAWIVPRKDSGALSLGLYLSPAGKICFPKFQNAYFTNTRNFKERNQNRTPCKWYSLDRYIREKNTQNQQYRHHRYKIAFLISGIVSFKRIHCTN